MRGSIRNAAVAASAFICASALLILSSSAMFGGLPARVFGLGVGFILIGGYLVWRGFVQPAGLPKSGLELPLAAFAAALLLSLVFSRNPRFGLERAAQIVFFMVLFYVLLDLMRSAQVRAKTRLAFLWVSGFLSMAALLETYSSYLTWWNEAGTNTVLPLYPYRFVSLAGHSLTYMFIANMCAPIAVVSLFQARTKAARFGSLFWLVTYGVAALFSNARAGWLAAGVWIAVLAAFWLREPGSRALLLRWASRYSRRTLITGGVLSVTALAITALVVYQVFAAGHPSHGTGSVLNRETIWGSALTVFRSFPLLGAGPGQATEYYLPASKLSPIKFWPTHAHSTPLQMLAEFGLLGSAALLAVLLVGFYRGMRALRVVSVEERPWLWAAVAAFAAMALQALFEDVSFKLFTTGMVVYTAAAILCHEGTGERFSRRSVSILAVPALIAAGALSLNVWSAIPFYRSADLAERQEWTAAAQEIEESIRRDPKQPVFWNQAGLLWSKVWQETGDPQALSAAHRYLEGQLAIEPGNSLVWANLAVLDWQLGDTSLALTRMQQAMEMSPPEPVFWLNYGALLEQQGQNDSATREYSRFLIKKPELISHPFWQSTTVRREAALAASQDIPDDIVVPYWEMAQTALDAEDFQKARLDLAFSKRYDKTPAGAYAGWAELADSQGDAGEARARLDNLLQLVESRYWEMNYYPLLYGFPRRPVGPAFVPGFLKLEPDGGQFDALAELVQLQIQSGECDGAAHTWMVLQNELRAWERADSLPPAPACP